MDNKTTKSQGAPTKQRVTVPGSRKQLLKLTVSEETTLLPFLLSTLPDKSRTTVKQLLHDRFIAIGMEPTTQFDAPLRAGDVVSIHPTPLPKKLSHPQIDIIYQDEYLIVVRKEVGIPTVASGEEKDVTALRLLSNHLKSFNPLAKVYHVTRLDKDSAGFVVFAKSKELQTRLSENWHKYCRLQQFAAVIEGELNPGEGLLHPPTPQETKNTPSKVKKSRNASHQDADSAGKASYRTLSSSDERSLLSIELHIGRNNRLRKQLSTLRHPIVGDWRNGSKEKELGYVALIGTHLTLVHPMTHELLDFKQPIPALFRKLLRTNTRPRGVKKKATQPRRLNH
jgi:probable RNA pseudouridylate synthase